MTYAEIEKIALDLGFTHAAPLDTGTVALKQEVRDMCKNGCRQYGKRWSCPPGCGSLEAMREKIAGFSRGILVQTVARLEDEFDAETMMGAQEQHKAHFLALTQRLREKLPQILPLGAGCCMLCSDCTYPHSPCRFPDKMVSSMEANGMLVMEVCQRNDLAYYYGPNTIAYTACILYKERML